MFEKLIRTGATWTTLTGGTFVFGSGATVAGTVGRPDGSDWCARTWSLLLLRSIGVTWETRGATVDDLGPAVLMCNHRSHLDGPLLLNALPFRFAFVIKRSLAKIPFFGWGVTRAGYVSIDRSDHADAMAGMTEAVKAIRGGRRVLVFPEGTRSPTGDFLPFKKGGVVLALNARVPVLPIAIAGTRALLPRDSLTFHSGHAVVNVGEPIPTEGLAYEDRNALLGRVEAEIRRLYGEAEAALDQK